MQSVKIAMSFSGIIIIIIHPNTPWQHFLLHFINSFMLNPHYNLPPNWLVIKLKTCAHKSRVTRRQDTITIHNHQPDPELECIHLNCIALTVKFHFYGSLTSPPRFFVTTMILWASLLLSTNISLLECLLSEQERTRAVADWTLDNIQHFLLAKKEHRIVTLLSVQMPPYKYLP